MAKSVLRSPMLSVRMPSITCAPPNSLASSLLRVAPSFISSLISSSIAYAP